jgi:predicted unusual protein kinase regulating ubiquinone biosynthesis (AarF/ABC1/UbiB family)
MSLAGSSPPDPNRYRRVRNFFVRTALHIFWWDIFLNRRGLRRFRKPPLPRWQRLAREYRSLAGELCGILIKLGQFLSTRADILPPEIIEELTGLQDEVPAVPIQQILAQITADFGQPVETLFAWFSTEAVGSASLAQVHNARLLSGEQVAVKVLRPNIAIVMQTDLGIVRKFLKLLSYSRSIRKYADLNRLGREFETVTFKELDLTAEGLNAERFAADFSEDKQTCVPKIYWDYVGAHTLTMEDVRYIRIDDLTALEAAGISRHRVAEKLFELYMQQILVTHFVHADPHPGNLFIKPLPHPDEPTAHEFQLGETAPFYPNRPFQIVFVDFGMAVTIPKRLRSSLRDYVIGIGTQDAHLIVESYLESGALLYDADLTLVEQMTQGLLDNFSGSFMGQMKDIDLNEYARFYEEYKVLLYNSPFQFQAELLFVTRALGILSGLTAQISPRFNPMEKVSPFAVRLMSEQWQPTKDKLLKVVPRLLRLPKTLEDVLQRAQRGRLTFQTELATNSKKVVLQLQRSVNRLALIVGAVGLFLAGTILHTGKLIAAVISHEPNPRDPMGIGLMLLAVVVFILGMLKRK